VRADRDRLADVLEAIERIERHTSAGREAFDTDEFVQSGWSGTSRSSVRLSATCRRTCERGTPTSRGAASSVCATSSFTGTSRSIST
jgi:hypothetical protein